MFATPSRFTQVIQMIEPRKYDLYLLAYLPDHIIADIRLTPAFTAGLKRPIEDHRLHITVLKLAESVAWPQKEIADAKAALTCSNEPAFHVVFDQLIIAKRQSLLKPSEPLRGAAKCQAALAITLGTAKAKAADPHVTLGYDGTGPTGVHQILPLSWQVEKIALVVSHHGEHVHEEIMSKQLAA
jgi:2'-5' RNA ligase